MAEEALAAQAIIARSFTLQKIGDEGGVPEHGAHASPISKSFKLTAPSELMIVSGRPSIKRKGR